MGHSAVRGVDLRGTTGQSHNSPLIYFLESIGFQTVDVQYGEGFLNYINGYTAKCSDSLDFRLNEHVRQGENSKWRMAYRMLCKYSPCIPEVFCHFASLPLMKRSFQIDVVFAPIQRANWEDVRFTKFMWPSWTGAESGGCKVTARCSGQPGKQLLLGCVFVLNYKTTSWASSQQCFCRIRGRMSSWRLLKQLSCRIPNSLLASCIIWKASSGVSTMKNSIGLWWGAVVECTEEKLSRGLCHCQLGTRHGGMGSRFFREIVYTEACLRKALLIFWPAPWSRSYGTGLVSKGRAETFQHRFRAVAAFYGYFADCDQSLKEKWSRTQEKKLEERAWSPQQETALAAIREGVNVVDANQVQLANRFLFLRGQPGSGKSEVLVHAAVNAAAAGCHVLVLCPTGTLVHSYRDKLPESERTVVEAIHSGFQICRTQDAVVQYSPPSRLRRYDLLLLDEASQVADHVTKLLFLAIQELPQKPFVAVAADFQQLNPIQGGGLMQKLCEGFPCIELCSVFRTKDPVLLSFLQSIRCQQPGRGIIRSFFQDRILSGSLTDAAQYGLHVSQMQGGIFSWLCVTNSGADKVNCTALTLLGVTEAEVAAGFPGDPKVGSSKIYIKPNLLYSFDSKPR